MHWETQMDNIHHVDPVGRLRCKYKCSTKWNTRVVKKSDIYYLSNSLKNLTFTYFPQVFKFKRKKDPSFLFQVYRWVVWGEPLLSRASLQVGAATYPFSLLYRYLIPTLCPPSEHQCSSGIVRHYCVQDFFFNPKLPRGLLTDCVICL